MAFGLAGMGAAGLGAAGVTGSITWVGSGIAAVGRIAIGAALAALGTVTLLSG